MGILIGATVVITHTLLQRYIGEGFQTAASKETATAAATARINAALEAAKIIDGKVFVIMDLDKSAPRDNPTNLNDPRKRNFIRWVVETMPSRTSEEIRIEIKNNYDDLWRQYTEKAEFITAKEEEAALEAARLREEKVQAIISPMRNDIFKIEFPRSFVEWAVQRSPSASADTIRTDLISNYDLRLAEFRTISAATNTRDIEWTNNIKQKTCDEIAAAKGRFVAMLGKVKESVDDLRKNGLGEAIRIKDVNYTAQQDVKGKCTTTNSEACNGLAIQDEDLITSIPWYEGVNTEIFNRQYDLGRKVSDLDKVLQFLGCTNKIFTSDELKEITDYDNLPPNQKLMGGYMARQTGLLNIAELRSRLNMMSPYYISPDVLEYLTQYLIDKENVDTQIKTYTSINNDLRQSSQRIKKYATF